MTHRMLTIASAALLLTLCGCGGMASPIPSGERVQAVAAVSRVPSDITRGPVSSPRSERDPAVDFCSGGILDNGAPLGTIGPDLVINSMTCTVDGTNKPYNFHNVYILGTGSATGTLTFSNATMDFYAANILVQNGGVLQATGIGAGDNGGGGQVLTIHLYGSPGDDNVVCQKVVDGVPANDPTCGVPTTPSDVWDSNKMNMQYPTSCTKTSQLDPPTTLPGGVDECFYQYTKLDGSDNNAYFGHKVLALSYGGTINFSGYKGAQGGNDGDPSVNSTSWLRLNATLQGKAGETSLQVSGMPSDWKPNDNIVVTSTDYLPGHAEQLQIGTTGVVGSTVNLNGVVQNPHWGQTYSLANVPCLDPPDYNAPNCEIGPALLPNQSPADRNLDVRAAVGLLSRSIRIVSDGAAANTSLPSSAPDSYFGGHTIVRQGFLSYQVQGVEFYQLGQGGAIGHYPVHFHMAPTTPTGTYVKDSSVWDSMTRWMTIHATQQVTLARNVGYKSIGHGYYLEDGTETDNVLNTNLGVFARAAVLNPQNDRSVPGILAAPVSAPVYDGSQPIFSDWQFPTVFWIMNGWNEFQYNFASSAGTCGVCYWDLPGGISGPSRMEYFQGYSGEQVAPIGHAGLAPLHRFVGNSCSSAMESFMNIGPSAGGCLGVTNNGQTETLQAVTNDVAPPQTNPPLNDPNYPYVTGLARPTQCVPDANGNCTTMLPCGDRALQNSPPDLTNCVVTTLDRYTTSFNWAAKNFSAIWLRRWWFLVENSAITDVQQGGITFVTGGGYTRIDLAQGFWSLMRTSALVGNTQDTKGKPKNPYAWSAGPFNPRGLQCDAARADFCLSAAQGISYPIDSFSGNQRLINIYDGPSHQERNAFLDIPASPLGPSTMCTNNGQQQLCTNLGYLYGNLGEFGLPFDGSTGMCYLPNAAIAWKQSNGFYYPPAFHSDKLFFQNVDIRHFVIEPLFDYGTFTTDQTRIKNRYCTWVNTLFNNFTDIDRQTVLNDDDGSLTGLLADLGGGDTRETISVNRPYQQSNGFFNDPKVTVQCASDWHGTIRPPGTADTSPNEYVTTATIADCGINRGGCKQGGFSPPDNNCFVGARPPTQYCAWGDQCSAGSGPTACYGVPLYRQYLTSQEFTQYQRNPAAFQRPTIRMMGQGQGQRSTLTVNHGKYYIDDQVTLDTQKQSVGNAEWNIYLPNTTYYTYFVYAKSTLDQTYQMFVGYGLNKGTVEASVQPYRAKFPSDVFEFNAASGASFLDVSYDDRPKANGGTGLVTVHVHLDAYASEFTGDRPQFCQPATYCTANGAQCECNPNNPDNPGCTAGDTSVCSWAIKDMDCPLNGCFAFGIKLPGSFQTGIATTPPAPVQFPNDGNWQTLYQLVDETITGAQCHYTEQPPF